jgi:hypothetical protein
MHLPLGAGRSSVKWGTCHTAGWVVGTVGENVLKSSREVPGTLMQSTVLQSTLLLEDETQK